MPDPSQEPAPSGRSRLAAVWPVAVFWAGDIAVTLMGQPPEYWRDYRLHQEGNPLFASLLELHPGAFLAGALLWLAGIALGARLLPLRLSWIWSLSFLLGHAFCGLTWLLYQFRLPFAVVVIYFPLVAAAVTWQASLFRGRSLRSDTHLT